MNKCFEIEGVAKLKKENIKRRKVLHTYVVINVKTFVTIEIQARLSDTIYHIKL